jgi:hypothetical protein
VQDQQQINTGDSARSVRNDDDGAPAGPNTEDGLRQRRLTLCIEVGVRLIQHHQEWISINGSRQRNALLLSSREATSLFSDLGLVAVTQVDDEVMHPGCVSRRKNGFGVCVRIKPGDILSDRPCKQLDVLGQLADVTAELFG